MSEKRNQVQPSSFLKGKLEIKNAENGVIIEGFANKSVVDRGNDIIPASAWEKGLENFKKNPVILFNHSPDVPIGTAQEIRATKEGLFLRAKISNSDDPVTSRIRNLIKDKTLRAFSVGFESKDDNKNEDGVNEITKAELFEVSVVGIPMNQESIFSVVEKGHTKKLSVVEVMKSLDEIEKEGPQDDEDLEEKQETPLELQRLVFSKSVFESKEAVIDWANEHSYKSDSIDETEASFTLNQRSNDEFVEGSLRTIQLAKGVQAVMGQVKSLEVTDEKQAEQEDGDDAPTVPIKTENTEDDFGNPHLETAKQTNVLLGQLISEIQQLRAQVVQMTANPPESKEGDEESLENESNNEELSHNLSEAKQRDKLKEETELAKKKFKATTQSYLESLNKRIARLGV